MYANAIAAKTNTGLAKLMQSGDLPEHLVDDADRLVDMLRKRVIATSTETGTDCTIKLWDGDGWVYARGHTEWRAVRDALEMIATGADIYPVG